MGSQVSKCCGQGLGSDPMVLLLKLTTSKWCCMLLPHSNGVAINQMCKTITKGRARTLVKRFLIDRNCPWSLDCFLSNLLIARFTGQNGSHASWVSLISWSCFILWWALHKMDIDSQNGHWSLDSIFESSCQSFNKTRTCKWLPYFFDQMPQLLI